MLSIADIQDPWRILIANDEPMQLYILQILFGKYNCAITSAINGYEAFEHVQKSLTTYQGSKDRNDLFDLVILDLNMPISNGFEACKNIGKIFNKT
jgi:CheY-like chemotaxis protein